MEREAQVEALLAELEPKVFPASMTPKSVSVKSDLPLSTAPPPLKKHSLRYKAEVRFPPIFLIRNCVLCD